MARPIHRLSGLLAASVVLIGLAACTRAADSAGTGGSSASSSGTPAAELRLGYFPNVTHAAALLGVDKGFLAAELGSTKLTTQTFNAGGDEANALLGGSLDVGFIGSSPAISAFTKSNGDAVRLIAGANSGGAQLVVKPGIATPEGLKGKTIATPQLGNTQDVALKKWLKDKGLTAGAGPSEVHVANLDNPRTLDAFKQGTVDGGWLPEPWSSQLVGAGASVLVDEKTLWPNGTFPTTVIIVRTQYLKDHPDTIRALLRGELKAIDYASSNPAEAKTSVNDSLKKLTGSSLPSTVIDRAFSDETITYDPDAAAFPQLAKDGVTAGVSKTAPDLNGLVDLGSLNAELQAAGKPAVDAAGLDKPKG